MDGMTLQGAEQLAWRLLGWNADQRTLDALLAAMRAHVAEHGAVCDCPTHLPDPAVRECRACGLTLPLTRFSRDSKGLHGRRRICMPCDRKRKRTARTGGEG
jgi:hypothetical protein